MSASTRLGPYEVLQPLGAGGMGEVYRAKDTRLDRNVAIKVLPAHLGQDPQFKERFEREARAISSLHHPHICTLHDVGHQDGTDFLVMEYLDGETLEARLQKGPLPLKEALPYGIQIAGALDHAHGKGVVHRDLKPGNVMLTRDGAKLLDFGLAKLLEPPASLNVSLLPTQARGLTAAGTIMGTFQYMPPEQLEGAEADARSDIFALGAVLYEMITGRKAFEGKSQASLIAAILSADPPPVSTWQPLTPASLDRTIKTCLAKDPDNRWQSARDLRRELEWAADPAAQPTEAETRAPRHARMAWAVAALAVAVALAAPFFVRRAAPETEHPVRFSVTSEAKSPAYVTISPDGAQLAYTGQTADGKTMIWLRPLDALTSQPLAGTEGAWQLFWSPDSRYIGFYADGKLRKIDSRGGPAVALADAETIGGGGGGDWNKDGIILFAPTLHSGIYRISSAGGVPVAVTKPDTLGRHAYPRFLPDGKHFLFFSTRGLILQREEAMSGDGIFVASLDSDRAVKVLTTPFSATLSYSGKPPFLPACLLFVRAGSLMAQEMDLSHLQLRGEPFLVSNSIATSLGYRYNEASASTNGILAFNPGVNQRALVWFDRSGKALGPGPAVSMYSHPNLAPGGARAVFNQRDLSYENGGLWLLDSARGTTSTLTRVQADFPVFSPDGASVAYTCAVEASDAGICRTPSGGAGREEVMLRGKGGMVVAGWSGQFLSYIKLAGGSRRELWIASLTGDKRTYRFYPSEAVQDHGEFSPDGKWIAYTSNETGAFEVYVQPFPAQGEKFKISTQGGAQPRWRKDGREMYYRSPDGKLMGVAIRTSPRFEPGVPQALFEVGPDPLYPDLGMSYAVTADGKRFLVNVARNEGRSAPITVVMNWTAGLRR